MSDVQQPTVVGYECRHVLLTPHRNRDLEDDHVIIKANQHWSDGTVKPIVKCIENYERSFYITAPQYRDHKQKKTYEHKEKLIEYNGINDGRLKRAVAKAIKFRSPGGWYNLRTLNDNPYVYGTDDTSPTIIKRKMMHAFKGKATAYTVCAVDIETNVTVPEWDPGYGKILMVGATFKNKAVFACTREYASDVENFEEKMHEFMISKMPKEVADRKIKLYIEIRDTPGQCVAATMEYIHKWRPDFLSTWNIAFDAPLMVQAVEDDGVDPANVFSDPSVPPEYRKCYWNEGPKSKITASGKATNLEWHEQWHVLETPASYFWVDAAAVYRWVRTAKGKEPSYKLDSILKSNINQGKLMFEELDVPEGGLEWHKEMQLKHKVEYGIYNLFDCIGLEMLDEETTDLSFVFPILMGVSEYKLMPSEPKRYVDDLVSICEESNLVMAGSPKEVSEFNSKVVSLKDWITTLPSSLQDIPGVKLFKDHPELFTNVYINVADLDVTGAYPVGQIIYNLSRETTKLEVCTIEGICEEIRRTAGRNLTAPRVNALRLANELFKLPDATSILARWDEEQKKAA